MTNFFQTLGQKIPRFGIRFTKSPFFEKTCAKTFREVDVDADGFLDFKELYIAILRLYDVLNSRLPCHIAIPKLSEVTKMMQEFDTDLDGKLCYSEFFELAKSLAGASKNFKDSLFCKALLVLTMKLLVFPMAGKAVRQGLISTGANENLAPQPLIQVGLEQAVKQMNLPLPM